MSFIDYFKEKFNDLSVSFWNENEKIALMRIIHGIYVSDNEFNKLEQEYFQDKLAALNIDAVSVDAMKMQDAFTILAEDKIKNKLVYIFMAEALFKDDDYDKLEKSYIATMKERYPLSGKQLDETISLMRDKKLEAVLKDWIVEIENTKITSLTPDD